MVLVVKFVDKWLGNLLCNFLGLFHKGKKIGSVNKIIVVQLWGIGETILMLPALEALRKEYPKAQIDVLATARNKDVFYDNKNLDNLQLIKLNPFSIIKFMIKNLKKYDLAFDMEEYLNVSALASFFAGKSIVGYSHGARVKLYDYKVKYNDKQHAVQTFLDLVRELKINYDADKLSNLNYSKNDKNKVDSFLKNNEIKSNDFLVCVAPGAAESAKARMWPFDMYAELCDEIILKYAVKIVFTGIPEENDLIKSIQEKMEHKDKTINAAGQINLNQLFCLMTKCKLFIGNDSGPMHIAAAQGIKTLGLFGPNSPVRFGPYGKGNIGLYKGYNCQFSPCINVHKGQVPDCLYPRNSNDYQKCMKNISVDDVLKEVEKLV
ncbi:glycosyltransferase family 9 protein [Candidatus Woesearchaeota archaeon]|nr:glycosyltransferase family 9 protein [Candidatus Woesearchaeota archaeon]